jgi:type II secretion system protein J
MTNGRRQSGFTLLEVVLAMAMVAMLALSLFASLRIGFKARQSATRAVAPVRAMQVAMDLVRQDLESALPPTGVLAGAFIGEHLQEDGGDADMVEFYCVGEGPMRAEPTGWGGIRKINMGVVKLEDGKKGLVREITSNLLAAVQETAEQEVLCRGVRSFTLRYFDGTAWQDMWDSSEMGDVLPMAVEVTIELEPPAHAAAQERGYRMTRYFALACRKEMNVMEGAAQ